MKRIWWKGRRMISTAVINKHVLHAAPPLTWTTRDLYVILNVSDLEKLLLCCSYVEDKLQRKSEPYCADVLQSSCESEKQRSWRSMAVRVEGKTWGERKKGEDSVEGDKREGEIKVEYWWLAVPACVATRGLPSNSCDLHKGHSAWVNWVTHAHTHTHTHTQAHSNRLRMLRQGISILVWLAC